ncbi:hypothetical protein IE53DRAFT_371496 [Violaceomyces palustris]|uniref:Uncharacterized protein n=1 Tax=Violaceomyces palustris TaxID=1673888 RepID=A0ACD0NNG8_9BASI|nr:hypothetical protein IE53DRAFT_371496 [Violaceomyces palustris]
MNLWTRQPITGVGDLNSYRPSSELDQDFSVRDPNKGLIRKNTANKVDLAICILSLLGTLVIIVPYCLNKNGRKLRHALILGLATSDLASSLLIIISTAALLGDVNLTQEHELCTFLGYTLATSIFTQHLWNLSIVIVTYMILVHPLSSFTLTVERKLIWLWPIFWAFALIVNGFAWGFSGFRYVGGYCSFGPDAGKLFPALFTFIPRAIVVIIIVVLYTQLFFFLRRTNLFKAASSISGSKHASQAERGSAATHGAELKDSLGMNDNTLNNSVQLDSKFLKGPDTDDFTDRSRRSSATTGSPGHGLTWGRFSYKRGYTGSGGKGHVSVQEKATHFFRGRKADKETRGGKDSLVIELQQMKKDIDGDPGAVRSTPDSIRRGANMGQEGPPNPTAIADITYGNALDAAGSSTGGWSTEEGKSEEIMRESNFKALSQDDTMIDSASDRGLTSAMNPIVRHRSHSDPPIAVNLVSFSSPFSTQGRNDNLLHEDESTGENHKDQISDPPNDSLVPALDGARGDADTTSKVRRHRPSKLTIPKKARSDLQPRRPATAGVESAQNSSGPAALGRPRTSSGQPPTTVPGPRTKHHDIFFGQRRRPTRRSLWDEEDSDDDDEDETDSWAFRPMRPRRDVTDFNMISPPQEHLNHFNAPKALQRRGEPSLAHVKSSPNSAVDVMKEHDLSEAADEDPVEILSHGRMNPPEQDFEKALGSNWDWGMDVGAIAANHALQNHGSRRNSQTPSFVNGGLGPGPLERPARFKSPERDIERGVAFGTQSGGQIGTSTSATTSSDGNGVESLGSTLNRQASLLMLLYPAAYCILFSVSIIRIIDDLINPPTESKQQDALHSISRWFIFAQGAFDAIIFQFIERHFRKRMRRRRKKALGEEVSDSLRVRVIKSFKVAWRYVVRTMNETPADAATRNGLEDGDAKGVSWDADKDRDHEYAVAPATDHESDTIGSSPTKANISTKSNPDRKGGDPDRIEVLPK